MHAYSSDADEDYSEDSYSSHSSSSRGHPRHHPYSSSSEIPTGGAHHHSSAAGAGLPPFGADVSMLYQDTEGDGMNNDEDDDIRDEEEELLDGGGGDAAAAAAAAAASEEYEPTDQEIQEYCEWLNMDPVAERSLIWIAREALKAPLPENWKMCYTDDREIYYFNMRTGESIWDHPMDAFYKSLYKEEKLKLDKKRKSMRLFSGSLETKAMSEFFSEVSETCGSGDDAFSEILSTMATGKGGSESQQQQPWRIVPENLIDPIDVRIFVDPIVLPTSGRTVSRHTIINNKWRDPFSREYVENRRLVPNVDKRGEVDRYLQAMVEKYFEAINNPQICENVGAGFRRLLILLPYMLDKDEEVCVRAQNFMQTWFEKNLLLATTQQQQQQQQVPSATASPALTPRVEENANGVTGRKALNSTTGAGGKKAELERKQSTSNASKKLQLSIAAGRSSTTMQGKSSTAQQPSAPPPPPPPQTLIDVIEHAKKEDRDLLVRCLLTMSSSASRETLLALVTAIPSLLLEPAFCKFSEDVLFVLRVSWKDLWEIANFINSREQAERNAAEASSTASSGQQQAPNIVHSSAVLNSSGVGCGGSAESEKPTPLDVWASKPLAELFSCHIVTDSERLLSLRWANILALAVYESLSLNQNGCSGSWNNSSSSLLGRTNSSSLSFNNNNKDGNPSSSSPPQEQQVVITHPIAMMDIIGGIHIALALHASPKVVPKNTSAIISLLSRCDGWPLKLSGCSDKHIRCLLELAVQDLNPKQQITSLFELCLQGSERCLDVIGRHAEPIKKNLIELSKAAASASCSSSSPPSSDVLRDGGSSAALAFTTVDLMAAVMVFHEMATLAEFAQACPPQLALKIGYNLTPRLTRSQWRPRHFHATVTTLQQLVDKHPSEAWVVMDRVGLTFFLKELTKKRSQVADIRAKLETLEQAEKVLDLSATHNRWALLAVKLLMQRQAEVDECVRRQRQKKGLTPLVPIPTSQPVTKQPAAATSSAAPSIPKLPSIRGASSSSAAQPPAQPDPSPIGGALSCATPPAEAPLNATGRGSIAPVLSLQEQLARVEARANDIVRQRSELLSQTLQLLITVRLKPKQRPPVEAQTSQQRKKAPGAQTPRGGGGIEAPPPPPPPQQLRGVTPRGGHHTNTEATSISLPTIS